MQLPERLAYILERDQALDGAVKLSISRLEPWIKNSHLPFFPEYTKHDLDHIEAVLRTAAGLIHDAAWEAITPSDAAVLILAVLLHDSAMHVSESGFISLLSPERSSKSIPGMNDKPWKILWEDFFGEATRFDGRSLQRLFGETQPVTRPAMTPEAMTLKDRLLIGEFLRRHHPRLAQEIAAFGVPTRGTNPLALEGLTGGHSHIASLSGLVARSHGANVRTFLPYLRDNFDVRQYKGVHPVILMTLLRVADYIQIDSERAPSQILQVKSLASPTSLGEWKSHHAIKDVRNTHEDPEALFVDAAPDDIQTFLKIESWLRGIQQELDVSWAVLGEVYGRYEGLNRLGLILRRVRSSLDNVEAFAKKAAFVPKKATFRAADADLLKLLIIPLYGNRPEVGLRELIQNAVDAVRELNQYRTDSPSIGNIPQAEQNADVVVTVEKESSGEVYVTIRDKGIGMTADIIIDYFLSAGASFRRSDQWRQLFESKDGKSKVLRAGRFGIGALAGFLLGPEMEITTRHVDEPRGIGFRAGIDSDAVELRKIECPVGTTIKIRISEALGAQLAKQKDYRYDTGINWDWYCLAEPSVKRWALGKTMAQKHTVPIPGKEIPPAWRKVTHADFEAIYWTYRDAPKLVCNGITVESSPESNWKGRFGLEAPNVVVFDRDAKLPLNLQRTGLAEEQYPFDSELVSEVCRDFIAFALARGPTACPSSLHSAGDVGRLKYEGTARQLYYRGWGGEKICTDWYFTAEGFGYLDAATLRRRGFDSVLLIRVAGGDSRKVAFAPVPAQPVIASTQTENLTGLDGWVRQMAEFGYFRSAEPDTPSRWNRGGETVLSSLSRRGARILISKAALSRAQQKKKLIKAVRELLKEEARVGDWRVMSIGNCPDERFDLIRFVTRAGANLGPSSVLTEVYLDSQGDPAKSPVAEKWMEVLKCDEIPFDPIVRRDRLKSAYKELSANIISHEAIRKAMPDATCAIS